MRLLLAASVGLALAATLPAGAAGWVATGRTAQALRCAAYVGMAGQSAYDRGSITAADRAAMAEWSLLVLERWVPLDPGGRIAAYSAALDEMGPGWRLDGLVDRHADWCLATFSPAGPTRPGGS